MGDTVGGPDRRADVPPLDSKTYDFIRDLMDTYQARPIDRKSFSALVNMMLSAYLAGEISGKRKDRARRKGGTAQ